MGAPVFYRLLWRLFSLWVKQDLLSCSNTHINTQLLLWQERLKPHILLMLRLCAQQSFEKCLLIRRTAASGWPNFSCFIEQKFSAAHQKLIIFYVCLGSVCTAVNGGGILDCWIAVTYHSRAWIWNFSLERDPLVIGPLFVSKGPQEGPPDVIHGVETHSWAFKHTAAGRQGRWVRTITKQTRERAHMRAHTHMHKYADGHN